MALAVNDALAGAAQEAEALLPKHFGAVTLSTLSNEFHQRMARHKVQSHYRQHTLQNHTHEEH